LVQWFGVKLSDDSRSPWAMTNAMIARAIARCFMRSRFIWGQTRAGRV